MVSLAFVFASIEDQSQRNALFKRWKENPIISPECEDTQSFSATRFEIELFGKILSIHRYTVRSWIARFEEQGAAGLLDDGRPGRPRNLDETAPDSSRFILIKKPRASRTRD